MSRNAAKYYKPYLWGTVGGGIVLLTLAALLAWQTWQSIPEATRVGNAAIDALVRLDQPQFNQLAYCPNCAMRTWAQWLNLVRSSGRPQRWQFQRIGRILEFGATRLEKSPITTPVFEVEYQVRFENLPDATIVLEVVHTEGGYRVLGMYPSK
jgi:hypothetical protein